MKFTILKRVFYVHCMSLAMSVSIPFMSPVVLVTTAQCHQLFISPTLSVTKCRCHQRFLSPGVAVTNSILSPRVVVTNSIMSPNVYVTKLLSPSVRTPLQCPFGVQRRIYTRARGARRLHQVEHFLKGKSS